MQDDRWKIEDGNRRADCGPTAGTLSARLARSQSCDYNTDRSMDAGFKPKAEILPTHTPALFAAAVARAAELLRAGELVALPTETVYGLAANALDAQAVARIFEAKGRPANNPIIVHVAGLDMARRCVREWPALGDKLAQAFWPGPLTVVLP